MVRSATRRHGALTVALTVLVLAAGCAGADDGAARGDGPERAPAGATAAPVRLVTLNLLHGLFCPAETDACRAPERVQIFTEHLEAAGCPDLVGLQEIGDRLAELLPPALDATCDGAYTIEWQAADTPDRAMVLSRLAVVDRGWLDLANFPWEAYWVRVDSPQGPVDFLTGHFASGANDPPCAPDVCPPPCDVGISTNECHAVDVVDLLDRRPGGARLSVVAGDLNATPGSSTVRTLTRAGFVDAWSAAGRAECDPESHAGCTGGGDRPEPFVGLDTREGPGFDRRVDHVLVRPGPRCTLRVEAEAFAAAPRSEPLGGMWWASDHAGVLAEISCTDTPPSG